MLSEEEMWKGIERLCNEEAVINSLSGSSHHKITAFSSASKSYTITYGPSGKSIDADFSKVYKMYSMLCENGRLFNKDMENGGHDEIGMSSWNRPGSAMLAVIPHLDSEVQVYNDGEVGLML